MHQQGWRRLLSVALTTPLVVGWLVLGVLGLPGADPISSLGKLATYHSSRSLPHNTGGISLCSQWPLCHSVTLAVLLKTAWWLLTVASVGLLLRAKREQCKDQHGFVGDQDEPQRDNERILRVVIFDVLARSHRGVTVQAELPWEGAGAGAPPI